MVGALKRPSPWPKVLEWLAGCNKNDRRLQGFKIWGRQRKQQEWWRAGTRRGSLIQTMGLFFEIYTGLWILSCVLALTVYGRDRRSFAFSRKDYWKFLFSPWKIATFIVAASAMVVMAPYSGDPTWDAVDRRVHVADDVPWRPLGDRFRLQAGNEETASQTGPGNICRVDVYGELVLRPVHFLS